MPVNFNSRDFERSLKKVAEQAANDVMKETAGQLQAILDRLYRSHAGKTPNEVKDALARACREAEFLPDDTQLISWADCISAGTRIVVNPEQVHL